MQSFQSIKSGLEKLMPSVGNLIKGIILLIFLEAPKDLFDTFLRHWKKSTNLIQKIATIIAGLIVASFLLYGFWGLWSELTDWRTKEWRQEILYTEYQKEIKDFFNKYNEQFLAHDCDFMREVGADEAMFDKWNRSSYPKNEYSCEEFILFQKKYIIPIKIDPIEKTGDKYHAQGEAVVLKINQGESWKVEAMYFDLWKKLDWKLWHFNNPKEGPRKIQLEVIN